MNLVDINFSYTNEDLYLTSDAEDLKEKSRFDQQLCDTWDNAMENGAFWYHLNEVQYKNIPGKYNMVAQLNTKRHASRRKPQQATQVKMPFDETKFNFNKVKNEEILMKLQRTCSENSHPDSCDEIIINVSPIEYGHVLLIPRRSACIPQILDEYAIESAVEMCLLSRTRAFSVGFNSLCALASVNHQHLHAFYVEKEIPIDRSRVKLLEKNVYALQDFLVNAFVVQLCDDNITKFSRLLSTMTTWLADHNIAHNLFMRRREAFDGNGSNRFLTVYIFPKKVCPATTDYPFNPASFEVVGFLCIRNQKEFDNLTEAEALEILRRYTYEDDEFIELWKRLDRDVLRK